MKINRRSDKIIIFDKNKNRENNKLANSKSLILLGSKYYITSNNKNKYIFGGSF